jgi:putative ABC transport system permease protein
MIFRSFIVRSLQKNVWRTLLTIVGIALGVAVMLSIHLANRASLSQFTDSLDRISGKSNAVMMPLASDLLDERLLTHLQYLWAEGVRFTPLLEQTVLVATKPSNHKDSQTEVIQLLGVDLFRDADFRTIQAQTTSETRNTETLFQSPNVLVSEGLAKKFHWKVGDTFGAQVADRDVIFKVAGIMAGKGAGSAYGNRLLVADISVVQDIAHLEGRISRIDLILPQDSAIPKSDLWQRIEAKLPQGVSLQVPKSRGEQVNKMARAFQQNLQALSFIALLVAMFLMYNTLSVAIIRRRPEIATLRALGMSGRQVFCLFLGESVFIGFLGNLFGVALGVLFAHLSLQNVALTVQTLYTGQPTTSLMIAWPDLLIAFLAGFSMTILATLQPLIEATTIAPALSLRPESLESRVAHASGKLAIAGLGVAFVALFCAFQPPFELSYPNFLNDTPVFGFLAAFLIFFACALLIPWLLGHGLHVLSTAKLAAIHCELKLAVTMMRGALGRTAVAIASLMIGIAMMISLSVMIASFRQTVTAWVNQTLQADIFVEAEGRTLSRSLGGISANVLQLIQQDPDVIDADGFYDVMMTYHQAPARLGAGDFSVLARHGDLTFLNQEPFETVMKRVLDHRQQSALISEVFANKHHLHTGDWLEIPLATQFVKRRVEGIYIDYASDAGYVIIDESAFSKAMPETRFSSIAIYLKPKASSPAVRDRLQTLLVPKGYRLSLRTNDELRKEVMRIFDATFAVTYALHAIAMAIAMLSVLNTLFMLVVAARREFGILKYLGFSARQIRYIVLWQAVILGGAGFLLGSGVGWLLSQLLIHVINKQSFGWTILPIWPWVFWLQSACLILITSLIAGILPARLATATLPQEILRDA